MLREELLVKLKYKKEIPRYWDQGFMHWEEYRGTTWMWRGGVRKGKAQLELNLARYLKNNESFLEVHWPENGY